MTIKLRDKSDDSIPSHDMKDGDMGVIVQWGENYHYAGRVVQRFSNHMVTIGAKSGQGWDSWFKMDRNLDCRVRLLQPGDVLEVQ